MGHPGAVLLPVAVVVAAALMLLVAVERAEAFVVRVRC